MRRVPYAKIIVEAQKLIEQMALAFTPDLASRYWNTYLVYINACGWTDKELDSEILRSIDNSWEEPMINHHLYN